MILSAWRNHQRRIDRDTGQRFEVRYVDGDGVARTFGYAGTTKAVDAMLAAIAKNPHWRLPHFIDREQAA